MFSYQSDGRSGDSIALRVCRYQQKKFNQGRGVLFEYIVIPDCQITIPQHKAVIDDAGLFLSLGKNNFFMKYLQQHLIKPLEFHYGPVVLLHEPFNCKIISAGFESELVSELSLIVEQQTIFTAFGQTVQCEADFP